MSLSMWLQLLSVFMLAVISPGPDFLLVLRQSLRLRRANGLAAAAGIGAGTVLWAGATLFGLVLLFHSFPAWSRFARWVGAGLLVIYGLHIIFSLWRAGSMPSSSASVTAPAESVGTATPLLSSFALGLVTTTVGNPKAVIFYSVIPRLCYRQRFP